MAFNFDFSYLKNGAPIVTLSSFGIAFNKGAIESLGGPDQVIIGFDQEHRAIGVRARGGDTTSPYYDFASRIKNDWVRIGAKDFTKYLSRISGIDFLTKHPSLAALGIVKARYHIDKRGLSRARTADNSDRVALVDRKVNIFK